MPHFRKCAFVTLTPIKYWKSLDLVFQFKGQFSSANVKSHKFPLYWTINIKQDTLTNHRDLRKMGTIRQWRVLEDTTIVATTYIYIKTITLC